MSATIKYKGNILTTITTNTTKTLETGGKYCEADIVIENTLDQKPEQEKTINPTESVQEVIPDEGNTLSKVTVGAIQTESKTVTDLDLSSGAFAVSPTEGKYLKTVVIPRPSTMIAENIKKDVSICGITGTLESGGGGVPSELLNITGNCDYKFANTAWNWVIDKYANQFIVSNITSAQYMFNNNTGITSVPFDINGSNLTKLKGMFSGASQLRSVPRIRGVVTEYGYDTFNGSDMLLNAVNLRNIEDLFSAEELEPLKNGGYYPVICNGLCALRTLPSWFYKQICPEDDSFSSNPSVIYNRGFYNCYSLDEIVNLPVLRGELYSNAFLSTFRDCARLKTLTFETNEDGSPIVAKWRNQTINLQTGVGYCSSTNISNSIVGVANGITSDKAVTDDASYQALKNDPDWYAAQWEDYSRYNHDSAVATINSLPDTTAYLATKGGTNKITFLGYAGISTDGGAIEDLTAQEIAVAKAKGWTVTLS